MSTARQKNSKGEVWQRGRQNADRKTLQDNMLYHFIGCNEPATNLHSTCCEPALNWL
jgi:hypothetical protein